MYQYFNIMFLVSFSYLFIEYGVCTTVDTMYILRTSYRIKYLYISHFITIGVYYFIFLNPTLAIILTMTHKNIRSLKEKFPTLIINKVPINFSSIVIIIINIIWVTVWQNI